MATYVELVKAVQRRLRVSETPSVASSDYSALLGDFVNQAKREVEDAWPWLALQTETEFSTSAGTDTYTLSGFRERAKIRRVHNTTTAAEVLAVDWYKMTQFQDFVTMSQNQPEWWRLNGQASGEWQIQFLPVPDQSYTIKVYGIAPQADLSADGDSLSVPKQPVILGAYLLAVAERGDDAGLSEQRAQREYQSALNDAVGIDNSTRHAGYSSDWALA